MMIDSKRPKKYNLFHKKSRKNKRSFTIKAQKEKEKEKVKAIDTKYRKRESIEKLRTNRFEDINYI